MEWESYSKRTCIFSFHFILFLHIIYLWGPLLFSFDWKSLGLLRTGGSSTACRRIRTDDDRFLCSWEVRPRKSCRAKGNCDSNRTPNPLLLPFPSMPLLPRPLCIHKSVIKFCARQKIEHINNLEMHSCYVCCVKCLTQKSDMNLPKGGHAGCMSGIFTSSTLVHISRMEVS